MKENERIVTITKVERLGTSAYGNAYYRLVLDNGASVRTKVNSAVNLDIERSDNLNQPVIITTTKAGRVYDIKPAGTPILFKVGDTVKASWKDFGEGVVTEVDHENAAYGGVMNYCVAGVWFCNEELTLIENGPTEAPEGA